MSRLQVIRWPLLRDRCSPVVSSSTLLLFFAAVFTMVALTSIEGALYRAARGEALDWGALIEGRLLAWLTCAAFVPPLYLLAVRLPIGRPHQTIALAVHLLASIVAVVGKYTLWVALMSAIHPESKQVFVDELRGDFLGELMFYWAMIGICHAVVFYTAGVVNQSANRGQSDGGYETATRSKGIVVPLSSGSEILETSDISWISAEGNYVRIHLGQRQLLVRQTLRALSEKLPPHFVQVHRSMVVNSRRVQRKVSAGQGKWRITLRDGTSITSGRRFQRSVRALLDSQLITRS